MANKGLDQAVFAHEGADIWVTVARGAGRRTRVKIAIELPDGGALAEASAEEIAKGIAHALESARGG